MCHLQQRIKHHFKLKKKTAYGLLFRPKRDGGHMGDWHEPKKSIRRPRSVCVFSDSGVQRCSDAGSLL